MSSTFAGRLNDSPVTITVTQKEVNFGRYGVIPFNGIESARFDVSRRCLTLELTQTQTFHRTGAYGSQTFEIAFAPEDEEDFSRLHRAITAAVGRRD